MNTIENKKTFFIVLFSFQSNIKTFKNMKFWISFPLYLLSVQLFAQATIGLDKINVLFVGVDNPLQIVVPNVAPNELEVKISEGTIQGANTFYTVRVGKAGIVRIDLFHRGKKIDNHFFRVKKLPNPELSFPFQDRFRGFVGMRKIDYKTLEKEKFRFVASLNGLDICGNCNVTSFTFTLITKQKEEKTVINNGSQFNDEIINLMKNAPLGSVLYFDAIKGKCPGDTINRLWNSCVINLK